MQPHQLATVPATVSRGSLSSIRPAATKAPLRTAAAQPKPVRPAAPVKRAVIPAASTAPVAAAAPRRGDAYQVLPGATYASAANAMQAATASNGDTVLTPTLSAPAQAQAPQALSAMLQPAVLRQPVTLAPTPVSFSPPPSAFTSPTTLGKPSSSSAFGMAETQAVRYAGGRCTDEIYRMAWSAADLFHIEPALVAALIETESACRNDAVSDAGARGLMQLIPHYGAREGYRFMHGADHKPTVAELRDPATNIQLGVAYLGALQDHFYFVQSPAARLILVIAAYNCGPDFVDQRLPDDAAAWSSEQAAQWVRRRTPAETRAFVVNVTEKAELFSLAAANARVASAGGKKNLSP